MQLIEEANKQRSVGCTAANSDSSRSHSIMQFALKRGVTGSSDVDGKLIGKISFIDLAGKCCKEFPDVFVSLYLPSECMLSSAIKAARATQHFRRTFSSISI